MVKYSQALDATFSALADPTRRAILARLALAETSVTELSRPFAMSLPAVSKHLRVLEHAGLVSREKDGRVHRCRFEAAPMKAAARWIAEYRQFWEERFQALERYLEESKEEMPWTPPPTRLPQSSGSRGHSRRRARKSSGPGPTRKR
jgi:DNA-binding transcriptional ArsR family regulator